jgi:predicted Zn-dependent peptidase
MEEKSGITQTYLCMGARTVNSSHKDTPALDLISTLLGGGTSSRLFTELREKYAVTYDVSSAHCKGIDFGYFSINCAVNNNKVDKTRALIFKELAKLREIDISPEELERVKQIMLGGVLRGMDNPHDCYEIITFMEMQHRSEYALKNYVEKIKAVTTRDIQDAANLYFAEDNFCSAIFNPLKSR